MKKIRITKKQAIAWLSFNKLREKKNIQYSSEHLLDYNIEYLSFNNSKYYKLTFEIELIDNNYNKIEIVVSEQELDNEQLSLLRWCLNDLKETLHVKPYFHIYELEPNVVEIHGGWLKVSSCKIEDQVFLKLNILNYTLIKDKK